MLPKIIIVGYGNRNPLADITPSRQVAEQYARILHILATAAQVAFAAASSTVSRENHTLNSVTSQACQDEIDLTHIQARIVPAQVLNMLHRHESVWSVKLETAKLRNTGSIWSRKHGE